MLCAAVQKLHGEFYFDPPRNAVTHVSENQREMINLCQNLLAKCLSCDLRYSPE